MIGLVAGGVGGFLVGSFIGQQARQMPSSGMNDNYNAMVDTQYGNQYSYYHGLYDYYGHQSGTNLGPLPGRARLGRNLLTLRAPVPPGRYAMVLTPRTGGGAPLVDRGVLTVAGQIAAGRTSR